MVDLGITVLEPDATGVTEPTPLSIVIDSASLVVQDKTAVCPLVIAFGLMERVHEGKIKVVESATVRTALHVAV